MAKLGLGSATLIAAGGIGIIQAIAAVPAIALVDTVGTEKSVYDDCKQDLTLWQAGDHCTSTVPLEWQWSTWESRDW